ncbi:hypothetical protein Tco_1186564 [Tanacetum coccineum]
MAPLSRSNTNVIDEILASLREPIAQIMREEMEKLRDEMRTTTLEASTSKLGRNQVYRGEIMQRFDNSFDDPLGELKNCKFKSSIEEYQNSFNKLLNRVDIWEDQATLVQIWDFVTHADF